MRWEDRGEVASALWAAARGAVGELVAARGGLSACCSEKCTLSLIQPVHRGHDNKIFAWTKYLEQQTYGRTIR